MAIASTLRAFPKEKAIVANEIASKMYRTFPYFVGKAISELPLVALFNSTMMAILYKLCNLNPAKGKMKQFLGLIITVCGNVLRRPLCEQGSWRIASVGPPVRSPPYCILFSFFSL